jgi:RNA polymerase sigma factor (sigma-70 family)
MVAEEAPADTWTKLYRAAAPAAMGFAFALCAGDQPAAEDLFHDAFVSCVRREELWADRAGFERYLRRAMVNRLIDDARKERRRRQWLIRQPRDSYTRDGQEALAERDGLVRALRLLPARQRAAVVARTCLDLSEAEAAQLMGCSVGNVKSLTSRGLASLRVHLTRQEA